MGLGIGGIALDAGRGMMDDPNSNTGKAMGIGSSALQGAGMGAMLGPWGALIGGLLGGAYGAYNEFSSGGGGVEPDDLSGKGLTLNDGVIMDGKITPFDKKDDVLKFQKTGGAIDKAVATGGAGMSNIGGTTKIHISFDELKVSSDGNVGTIDLSRDSSFMRELATKLKQSINQTANGGVLNPNPSTN
jgi:hypothetical protein